MREPSIRNSTRLLRKRQKNSSRASGFVIRVSRFWFGCAVMNCWESLLNRVLYRYSTVLKYSITPTSNYPWSLDFKPSVILYRTYQHRKTLRRIPFLPISPDRAIFLKQSDCTENYDMTSCARGFVSRGQYWNRLQFAMETCYCTELFDCDV